MKASPDKNDHVPDEGGSGMTVSAVIVVIAGILVYVLATSEWGQAHQPACFTVFFVFMAVVVAINLGSRLQPKDKDKGPQQ